MGRRHPLKSVQRRYWELIAEGIAPKVAGQAVGVSEGAGAVWFRQRGGVKPHLSEPRGHKCPRLTQLERDEIMVGFARVDTSRMATSTVEPCLVDDVSLASLAASNGVLRLARSTFFSAAARYALLFLLIRYPI